MNQRILSVTILLVFVLCSVNCQSISQRPNQQNAQENAQRKSPESLSKQEPLKWSPLPPVVLSPYMVNTTQLARVEAGDTLALPIAGGFKTLTLTSPLKDGIIGIKDLKFQIKDIQGNNIDVIVKSLHTHNPKGDEASLVWHNLTAKPDGGVAMDLVGAFESGKLVGYKYDLTALEALAPGSQIALIDEEGWRVIKVKAPWKDSILEIEGFKVPGRSGPITRLQAFDSREGKAGLVWDAEVK